MCRSVLRFFILSLTFCLVFSPYAQEQTDLGEQLITVPYTTVPPTLDGQIGEQEWNGANSNTVDFINLGVAGNGGPGDTDGTEDASFSFHVLYDDTYVYIGVDVSDDIYVYQNYGRYERWDLPVTWENDAVEYFFDGDLSQSPEPVRTPEETATGGQWIYINDSEEAPLPFVTPELYGESTRTFGTGDGDEWYVATSFDETTGDWSQEARFALSIIGSPSPGDDIGFNIAIDDVDVFDPSTVAEGDTNPAFRDIQLYWSIYGYLPGELCQENTHDSEELWGIMRFSDDTDIQNWELQ